MHIHASRTLHNHVTFTWVKAKLYTLSHSLPAIVKDAILRDLVRSIMAYSTHHVIEFACLETLLTIDGSNDISAAQHRN